MGSKPTRVVIENVQPEIEGGRFPIKRTIGETVVVTADIYADGPDLLYAQLKHRPKETQNWAVVALQSLPNDVWQGSFSVPTLCAHQYTLTAWIDRFASWSRDFAKKVAAGQDVAMDLRDGLKLIEETISETTGSHTKFLRDHLALLKQTPDMKDVAVLIQNSTLKETMSLFAPHDAPAVYDQALEVRVERERARYGAWYEMFPRSTGKTAERGATFRQAEAVLPDIAAMGFDVLYLPPVHPIGTSYRKGPNNSPHVGPSDPGSPWAIGAQSGGHTAIHPDLGTEDDFKHFVAAAKNNNLEIALDMAFQCSPDHPYVKKHPEWFLYRPDGSIRYAENPPKKYEDIYPLDFSCAEWESLWNELRDVVLFWVAQGVKIFRVDNPHTKPFRFWEWLIAEVRQKYPDAIFLAEAFTRPKVMAQLAKCGFSQSYSYFTWRNTKSELTEYFTELNQTPLREFMRPNLFANTPDILHAFLQTGGRSAFLIRLVLAATLGAAYGIYGPPFELCETRAFPNTEDYVDSEKYQIRVWNRNQAGHIKDWIAKVNRIRRENPALQFDHSLHFYETTSDQLLAYSKTDSTGGNTVLTVVNLSPSQVQIGAVRFLPQGVAPETSYSVHDVLNDQRYTWSQQTHYIRLDPSVTPAHIFIVERPA